MWQPLGFVSLKAPEMLLFFIVSEMLKFEL